MNVRPQVEVAELCFIGIGIRILLQNFLPPISSAVAGVGVVSSSAGAAAVCGSVGCETTTHTKPPHKKK